VQNTSKNKTKVTVGGMIRPEAAIDAMSSAVIVTPLIFATGRARLVRVTRALLVTSATLLATLALAQTDAGSELDFGQFTGQSLIQLPRWPVRSGWL